MIRVYCDGGSLRNGEEDSPASAGCLFLKYRNNEIVHWKVLGKQLVGSNNVAELNAAIFALSNLQLDQLQARGEHVTIYSDSQYVIKGASLWLKGWKASGWLTAAKKPVANKALWEKLDSLKRGWIEWKHVDGHSGVPGNEVVDFVCRACYRLKIQIDTRNEVSPTKSIDDILLLMQRTYPSIK